ncbi:MAG: helix-turn-helix domain-containing protein [Gemmatimonas sp.]
MVKPNPSAMFRYAERLPHASLSPWIACYWEFTALDGAPPVHNVPPDGCSSLLVPVGGPLSGQLLYTGPWTDPLVVPVAAGARFVGVRLRPGVADTVLHLPVASLLNATIPALQIGSERSSQLQDALQAAVMSASSIDHASRLFDAFWLEQRAGLASPDETVSRAVDAIVASNGEMSIAEVARAINCAERTLLRRFRARTALSPKQFARIRRLLAAAWHAIDGEERWGRIAAASGYADQPHLNHDMKALTGLRPEELTEQIGFTEHDGVSRRLSG